MPMYKNVLVYNKFRAVFSENLPWFCDKSPTLKHYLKVKEENLHTYSDLQDWAHSRIIAKRESSLMAQAPPSVGWAMDQGHFLCQNGRQRALSRSLSLGEPLRSASLAQWSPRSPLRGRGLPHWCCRCSPGPSHIFFLGKHSKE